MPPLKDISTIAAYFNSMKIGSKFTLKESDFTIQDISTLISTFFASGQMDLTLNKINSTTPAVDVDCTLGAMFFGELSLQANLNFQAKGSTVELEITISTFKESKTVSRIFADLSNTIFDDFIFSVSKIRLNSSGKYNLGAADWSPFSNDIKLLATNNLPNSIPAMRVDASPISAQLLNVFGVKSMPPPFKIGLLGYPIKGGKVAYTPVTFIGANNSKLQINKNISASLYAGIAAIPIIKKGVVSYQTFGDLSAACTFKGKATSITASAVFYDLIFMPLKLEIANQLNDLDDLATQVFDNDSKGMLPANFPAAKGTLGTTLTAMLLVNTLPPTLHSLSIDINYAGEWDAVPGFLMFSNLDLDVTLYPGDEPAYTVEISADLQFAGADFDGGITISGLYEDVDNSYRITQNAFHFAMQSGDSVRISDIFEKFGVPMPAFGDLTCDQLVIEGDILSKYFNAQCHFNFSWKVAGVTLTGAGLSIWHFPEYNSVNFIASLTIKKVQIDVLVEYDNGSYLFEIDFAGKGLTVNIQEYLGNLGTNAPDEVIGLLNNAIKLVSPYLKFSIDKAAISFTNTKNYSIEFDAKDNGVALSCILQCTDGVLEPRISAGQFTLGVFPSLTASPRYYLIDYAITNTKTTDPILFDFKKLLLQLATNYGITIGSDLVPDISITINKFLIAYKSDSKNNGFVAYLELAETFSISKVPLVGSLLPGSSVAGINLTKLIYVSENISPVDIGSINTGINQKILDSSLTKGLSVLLDLNLDEGVTPVQLNDSSLGSAPATPVVATATTGSNAPMLDLGDGVKWKKVNKHFGPMFVENIGFSFANQVFKIGITGSVSLGPLTAELIGLTISSPLRTFSPSFGLSGIALDFNKPPMTVAGFLLKDIDSNGYTEFNGGLIIDTGSVSIAALGSYALAAEPSLFLYGFLGLPMNGQPIISITGLAAGFGINRTFTLPPPDGVADFPLLKVAENDGSGSLSMNDLMTLSSQMQTDFKVQPGFDWWALGIRLDILELIDGFIMMAPVISSDAAINIAGIYTLVAPSGVEHPLAEIQIAFIASYDFNNGILQAQGGLTSNSWIIDTNAQLRGDFLMVAFFKNQPATGSFANAKKGDFIISAGGFGPLLKNAPAVPYIRPITLNWKVSDKLLITANAYFALVPHAMVAGGSLAINFQDEGKHYGVSATANFSADFMVQWKPLHYVACIAVSIHLDVKVWLLVCTKHVNMSASADLDVYGPPFSGQGTVSVHVLFTFDVHVSWGNKNTTQPILNWDQFAASFLPPVPPAPPTLVPWPCSITVKSGMLKKVTVKNSGTGSSEDWYVVNPKTFSISVASSIPSKSIKANWLASPTTGTIAFGIRPMGLAGSDFNSAMTVDFKGQNGTVAKLLASTFNIEAVTQNLPASVWGDTSTDKLVENALVGLDFTINGAVSSAVPLSIDPAKLAFDEYTGPTFAYKPSLMLTGSTVPISGLVWAPANELFLLLGVTLPVTNLTLDKIGLENIITI